MAEPFKFRYVNQIAGVFVLLALGLLAAAVFMAGRAQGLFEQKLRLKAEFSTSEGSFGLQKGAEIRILDTYAGNVGDLVPNDQGVIQAAFIVKGGFHRFIRSDSKAIVKKKFALAGDSYVEITVGDTAKPLIADGSVIECIQDTEIITTVMNILEEVQAVAVKSMEKIQMVLDELPALTVQANRTLGAAEALMAKDAPDLIRQAEDTLRETKTLIEALQRTWLLRGHVDQLEQRSPIAPSDIGPVRRGPQ